METFYDVYQGFSVGLAILIFTVYFVYVGFIKKDMTAVGIKRVWLISGLILSSMGLVFGKNIFDKLVLFSIVFLFALVPGHIRMHPSVKENRRPLSSSKNLWEKILIFFWY